MSVILDALRRGRRANQPVAERPSSAQSGRTVHVPSGLGLGSAPIPNRRPARTPRIVAGALLVVGLGAWGAIQFARSLERPQTAAPVGSSRPATPQPARPASAPASQPSAPVESPVATAEPPQANLPLRVQGATHFDQAVRHHLAGRVDDAATEYLAAIAADDHRLEAHNNLGLLYRSRGQATDAVDQFRRALALDPKYVKARNDLAAALLDSGRFSEARDEITAALAIDPHNADLLVNLALVEKGERHDERAMELLLSVLGDHRNHAAAHYNLALLYDQRQSLALAYSHYRDFLSSAGPEYASSTADVRRRAEAIAPLLSASAR